MARRSRNRRARDDAHVEQEEAEDSREQLVRERVQGGSTPLTGDHPDEQAAEDQEDAAVKECIPQQVAPAATQRSGRAPVSRGPGEGDPGKDHRHDDGRRLHQGHGGHHVAAVGNAGPVQECRGRDEGHRADAAVGGGDGCRVVDVQPPAQDPEAVDGAPGPPWPPPPPASAEPAPPARCGPARRRPGSRWPASGTATGTSGSAGGSPGPSGRGQPAARGKRTGLADC